MSIYKFGHAIVNDLRINEPNHEPLTARIIKMLENNNNSEVSTVISNGLIYRLNGSVISVYASIGNSLSSNRYVDYYFKQYA